MAAAVTAIQWIARVSVIRLQALDSPVCMFGDNRVLVATELLQKREKSHIAAVGHGDDYVAAKTIESCPLDWRTTKDFTKLLDAEASQPLEIRINQLRTGFELRSPGSGSVPVPGADILADVAAKNLPSDAGT